MYMSTELEREHALSVMHVTEFTTQQKALGRVHDAQAALSQGKVA